MGKSSLTGRNLANSSQGYFVFGMLAFLFVAYTVVFEGRAHARALGNDIAKVYTICGVWTIFLWFLYPIAWGISEGGNVISSDGEAIFYGILDVLVRLNIALITISNNHRPNQSSELFSCGDTETSTLPDLVFTFDSHSKTYQMVRSELQMLLPTLQLQLQPRFK